MPNFDLERLINEPIYAFDFQRMIGDVADFLDFSEINIELKYRQELQGIHKSDENGELPSEYREHLEENAKYRFEVNLPLRVRYGAVLALITSVEWSVSILEQRLKQPISYNNKPKGCNETVHVLTELQNRTGKRSTEVVEDYKALVNVRNCIAHTSGIEKMYKHRSELVEAINRLTGFSLDNWDFLGKQVCIQKDALTPYIEKICDFIVKCHESAEAKGLSRDSQRR